MAKGQKKSNRETRKPKKTEVKTVSATPMPRGLPTNKLGK